MQDVIAACDAYSPGRLVAQFRQHAWLGEADPWAAARELMELADALAEFHQEKPAQVLKNLRHRENIRRKAQRVKALSKNQKGPKYTSLFHTVDGNRIECIDKVSMEKACTAESLLRYT